MKIIDRFALPVFGLLATTLLTTSCTVKTSAYRDEEHTMEVSIPEQRLGLFRGGKLLKTYPVSTSKFGIGDEKGSYRTPLGKFEVAEKIGGDKPLGAVFKSRQWTGEVLEPDAPGRDPIVSRILWLHGLEPQNKNAYSRCIYIHGTAAEKDVGTKASYGCVRMKSKDIAELFEKIGWGTQVRIVDKELPVDDKPVRRPRHNGRTAAVGGSSDWPSVSVEPVTEQFSLEVLQIDPKLIESQTNPEEGL